MEWKRYCAVTLLLVLAALGLRAHSDIEVIPPSEPLYLVPHTIEGWTGQDMKIDQETLDTLGNGDFLSRVYTRPGAMTEIGLFIAYFPSQRTGATIHSPKNCLPGAGWVFDSSRYVHLKDAAGRSHQVGEYVVSNGDARQFVIYWYLAHGRSVASEYMAKYYLVRDAMRMNRTDGSLVRVITPIGVMEDTAKAKERAEAFTETLMPILPRFIPN